MNLIDTEERNDQNFTHIKYKKWLFPETSCNGLHCKHLFYMTTKSKTISKQQQRKCRKRNFERLKCCIIF